MFCIAIYLIINIAASGTVLFNDTFSDFSQTSPGSYSSVTLVHGALGDFWCPGSSWSSDNFCAQLGPNSYLQTNPGLINTMGYRDLTLSFKFAFDTFDLGFFAITGYPNGEDKLSSAGISIASYNKNNFEQNMQHHIVLSLGSWAQNRSDLRIAFSTMVVADVASRYVYLADILLCGDYVHFSNETVVDEKEECTTLKTTTLPPETTAVLVPIVAKSESEDEQDPDNEAVITTTVFNEFATDVIDAEEESAEATGHEAVIAKAAIEHDWNVRKFQNLNPYSTSNVPIFPVRKSSP